MSRRTLYTATAFITLFASACSSAQQAGPVASEPESASQSSSRTVPPASSPPVAEAPPSPLDRIRGARQVPVDDYHYLAWNENAPLTYNADQVAFKSPSGNITCSWWVDGGSVGRPVLNCYLAQRSSAPPPRPADCPEDGGPGWGTNFVRLAPEGAEDGVCTGGILTPGSSNVLAYDSALVAGDFGCLSEESGVTCVHVGNGRGFHVKRAAFTAF